jgi:hypothetical protein
MGCVFFSEQEYEYILLKTKLQITQYVVSIAQDCNKLRLGAFIR